MDFYGVYPQTACHPTKFLLGVQGPDIMSPWVEASLSDRLHWCGLQDLG